MNLFIYSFYARMWCLCWQLAKLEAVQQRTTVEDNTHVRPYIVKLINVALSFLALLLVVISFIVNLLHPFISTRSDMLNLIDMKCFVLNLIMGWCVLNSCHRTCLLFQFPFFYVNLVVVILWQKLQLCYEWWILHLKCYSLV